MKTEKRASHPDSHWDFQLNNENKKNKKIKIVENRRKREGKHMQKPQHKRRRK